MNLFSFLLPHTRVPGAPHNSEALVRDAFARPCTLQIFLTEPCDDLPNPVMSPVLPYLLGSGIEKAGGSADA